MIRLFARQQEIIRRFVQAEACAPIIKVDAITRQYNATAKVFVVALDKGNHISFVICSTQINSAAAERFACFRQQGLLANKRTAFGCIFLAQHSFHLSTHIARVSNILHAIGKSQLHSFYLLMQCCYAVTSVEFKALQYIQSHQRCNTMTVRRHFPHIIATVINMHRFNKFRTIISQICQRQITAGLFAEVDNFFGKLTAIIAFTIAFRQQTQGFGMVWKTYQLACARCHAFGRKGCKPGCNSRIILIRRQRLNALLPEACYYR